MIATALPGTLSISVDLETCRAAATAKDHDSLESTIGQLLALCSRHDITATWAFGDPAGSPLAGLVWGQNPGHEIALLADAAWSRREATRRTIVGPLANAVAACRDHGRPLRSLVLRSGRLDQHWDVLTKHGLTAVRVADQPRPATRGFAPFESWRLGRGRIEHRPHVLRWGLWELPVTLELTPTNPSPAAPVIKHLATHGGIATVAVDAGGERRQQQATIEACKRVMQLVAAPLAEGRIQVATLGEIVERLVRRGPTVSSRSILRSAA